MSAHLSLAEVALCAKFQLLEAKRKVATDLTDPQILDVPSHLNLIDIITVMCRRPPLLRRMHRANQDPLLPPPCSRPMRRLPMQPAPQGEYIQAGPTPPSCTASAVCPCSDDCAARGLRWAAATQRKGEGHQGRFNKPGYRLHLTIKHTGI